MVACAYNSSAWEAEAGRQEFKVILIYRVRGQPRLPDTPSQKLKLLNENQSTEPN